MSEHYTKKTTEVPAWCNKCNRNTQHRVAGGRLLHCLEHLVQHRTKAQQKRERKRQDRQLDLFA